MADPGRAPVDPGAGVPDTDAEVPEGERASDDPFLAAHEALTRARLHAQSQGLRPGAPARRRRDRGESAARRGGRGAGGTGSGSGPSARDPQLLGGQLDRLLIERGWGDDVKVGSLMGDWPRIVGPEVAAHVTPVTFEGGVLTLRADSTAWATQLRLMSSTLMGRLESEVGHGVVDRIAVQGPAAPSWSRGPRRVRGPGPRDTYG